MESKFVETELEKAIKAKFYGVSNKELVRRINRAPDFGWDDEGCELERRMRKSNGNFKVQMQINTLVIINDPQDNISVHSEIEQDGELKIATEENTGLSFGLSKYY